MRQIPVMLVLVGMGYVVANSPSTWKWIAYLIPFVAFCLFIAAIFVLIFGKPNNDQHQD